MFSAHNAKEIIVNLKINVLRKFSLALVNGDCICPAGFIE